MRNSIITGYPIKIVATAMPIKLTGLFQTHRGIVETDAAAD